MVKKDCFAFRESEFGGCHCDALRVLECAKGKCSFYKPKRITISEVLSKETKT